MKFRVLGPVLAFAALTFQPALSSPLTTQRFTLTRYYYGYQADTRKPLPPDGPLLGPKGESLFSVRPLVGVGPWFGYGHSMWHRQNLTEMRHAGIDVALPVFRGDAASLAGYAERGLDSLAEALIELKRDHLDYPLIGMYFDTTSLGTPAKPLDVSGEAGKAAFYAGIKRFYLHVPEEFRALVPLASGQACLLAVGPVAPLSGVDPSLKSYCQDRFRRDFGRGLFWVAEADWKAKVPGMEAFTTFTNGRRLDVNSDGGVSIACIGPGFNDSALGAASPAIRSRSAGLTMIDDWRTVFKGTPDWILVDSWNDYRRGSAIAGSREYGVRDQDETMAGLLQFRAESGVITQALRVNAPDVMPPRAVVPVEIVVQNGSLEQWGRGNISYGASWYQDGKLVEEGPKVPVMQPVPMMGLLTIPVAAVTARGDGTPLPDGKYELRVQFYKSTFDTGTPLLTPFKAPAAIVPVTIGVPAEPKPRLVTSDVSPYLMAGAPTMCHIVLRNDGPAPWPKATTSIAWKIVKSGDDSPVATGQSAALTADVPSGGLTPAIEMGLLVPKGTDAGASDCTLTWEVVTGDQHIPVLEAPATPARRSLEVLPLLELAHYPFGNSAPPTWDAGSELDIRAVVRNVGPTTWKASDFRLGYHWYYWDGTEALWEGLKTPLPADQKPGTEALLHCTVTAPPVAGTYILQVDLWDGSQWVSTLPGTAEFDTGLAYVNVTGGDLRPVDLTGLFDVDGIASEGSPEDGDFAEGMCYPGEQVPPDVQAPLQLSTAPRGPFPTSLAPILYPAGYFGPVDVIGTQSIRRIPFRFPAKKDKDRNFILSRGQPLPLGQGAYNRIYILGAATADTSGEFKLNYVDGTSDTIPLQFSGWQDGPKHGEPIGLCCTYLRSAKGDDPTGKAYLYVYTLNANPAKSLTSITFPLERKFRVCSITADHKAGVALPAVVR